MTDLQRFPQLSCSVFRRSENSYFLRTDFLAFVLKRNKMTNVNVKSKTMLSLARPLTCVSHDRAVMDASRVGADVADFHARFPVPHV